MVVSQTPPVRKASKLEGIKERSNFLREPVATELLEDTTHFSGDAIQILKFHGSYQQDNRDNRVKGQEKDYQFMLRTRSPGGFIPPELYLTLDRLSDQYGNHTLRVTTRQGFQLHGILKKNLKATIAAIIRNMGSTLGACGDLNRNVMAPPAPYKNRPEYQYTWEYADKIADLLTPQTGAYYEIWLDGEKAISAEEAPEVKAARQRNHGTIIPDNEEPIYGTHYMPRKFKYCVTVPGDNSVDLYTQDVSLVVITNQQGELEGFNVLAGGGLGRTHNKEETFARMADAIGYVEKDDVFDLAKAIVATQRDYGDRADRRHARMKYLINDWGVEKFRETVEGYFGKKLAPYKPLPAFKYQDYLGWNEQGDGKLFLGISIENGRIKDEGTFRLKTALREIVEQFALPMRLTPNHNIIIYEIAPEQQLALQKILDSHGVHISPEGIDPLVRYSMACPALPTCGLAITESERAIPGIIERIRALLEKLGLQNEHFVIRSTGCPNGCARPYMAELGFVGSAPDTYQVWLGGSPDQTRLAQAYVDRMPMHELESFLEPILAYFKKDRKLEESFGDFCDRVGFDSIREFTVTYQSPPLNPQSDTGFANEVVKPEPSTTKVAGKNRNRRIRVNDNLHERLKEVATQQGKTMTELAAEALEAYLRSH
ncbi:MULTISPECIES: sulfite reductase, ferredoxin dependent [unclassified Coleofasciculus]|uniref:sulfite reductase, ferredoxin dependent n=1 Tax=unclassified Coleofasciculus TaxID=2692782 RepID=UPI00188170D1|nr:MULTISPECIES: sulfite reductase, ferredoxin dependent [unclassified Coleofasciculus]MBE9127232.1 sulfite reductase, ferredoxin dependent [Coleofasciculus sp. LEGE 07081]MBE9150524.1 sulfite reductase, ferredoxin dependent [Coleofasciculus sp. LEGE 07092]